ncbi:FUSC family protein [Streptomyces sp. VNUA116]|uniref:FUSC family protein n=1 Tax=Streptomyces sp. VNUA116 TaxID=3062449 RepID=UPI002675C441|nr:FUSC family protein [Streptomyces sp. VNUA116]WKU42969.1 FUSC family protein [Streptomyces sp. VNUA116]
MSAARARCRASATAAAARFSAPGRRLHRPSRSELAVAARIVVCATVAWYACVLLGTSHNPVPAALPCVLLLSGSLAVAPRLAYQRVGGVVLGAVLSVAVLRVMPHSTFAFPLVVVLGIAGSLLLRHDGVPDRQVVITSILIFAVPVAGYPEARVLETLVGAAVVILLAPLLWPPDPVRLLADGLDAYRRDVAGLLRDTAEETAAGRVEPPTDRALALGERPHALAVQLSRARRALRRPAVRRHRSARDAALAELGDRIELAQRTSIALRSFAEELQARAHRPVDVPLDRAVRALAPLIDATRRALDAALSGHDASTALRAANLVERQHRTDYPSPRDACLRSGLRLTNAAVADYDRGQQGDDGTSGAPGRQT